MSALETLEALLPEVVLLVAACASFLLGLTRSPVGPRLVKPLGLVALGISGALALNGSEVVAAGIAIGSLTHYLRFLTLAVGAVLLLVNWYQPADDERGEYFAMMLLSMTGVMLVGSSNDLILLFFALELVSVPTYVLVALSRTNLRAQEACSKYFFLGALAAALTAYGLSFLYGAGGSTTLFGGGASLADVVQAGLADPRFLVLGWLLFFGGLCFKIAAVPFHGYVGDVYQGAAAPLAGLLAFLPKLAGFGAMIKLAGLLNWNWDVAVGLGGAVWLVSAATMTVGNVLALMQTNIKRMLAYSSVAHSGYMLVGVLVGPLQGQGPFCDGLSALLFYIAVYGLMNLGAFAVLTALSASEREEAEEQEHLAGLWGREPLLAVALTVCMFSLMGLPPTAGFLGKVYVFSSALSVSGDGDWGRWMVYLVVIGVVNSAIAAAYYLRVVGLCFLHRGSAWLAPRNRAGLQLGTICCAVLMVLLFLWPQALLIEAGRASERIGGTPATLFAGTMSAPPVQSSETAVSEVASGSVTVKVVP